MEQHRGCGRHPVIDSVRAVPPYGVNACAARADRGTRRSRRYVAARRVPPTAARVGVPERPEDRARPGIAAAARTGGDHPAQLLGDLLQAGALALDRGQVRLGPGPDVAAVGAGAPGSASSASISARDKPRAWPWRRARTRSTVARGAPGRCDGVRARHPAVASFLRGRALTIPPCARRPVAQRRHGRDRARRRATSAAREEQGGDDHQPDHDRGADACERTLERVEHRGTRPPRRAGPLRQCRPPGVARPQGGEIALGQ